MKKNGSMVNRFCRANLLGSGDNVRPTSNAWPGDHVLRVCDQQYRHGADGHREMIMGAWTTFSSFYVVSGGFPYLLAPRTNGECDGS